MHSRYVLFFGEHTPKTKIPEGTIPPGNGYSLDAAYTYTDDLLTQIGTNSTIYSFTYGDFAQRSTIEMGEWSLASYDYTDDQNRYLDKLTYGNGDFVNYTYDAYGRVTAETFEDGDTVTYEYDNTGALATVTDSATGIKTSYYYDLTDRLMKYVESDGTNTHSVGYEYDTLNNLTLLVETINGVPHTTSYAYDDDNRVTSVTASLGGGSTKKEYTYDNFGRVGNRVTSHNGANILTESFNFHSLNETSTTGQIASVAYTFGGSNVTYSYTYDGNGNITSVSDGTYVTTYVYDSANQLTRENNQAAGKTWVWTYDDAGNILTKQEYAYTTGTLGTVVDTITYTYSDSDWGDLLTGYGDETIRYDGIGNPILDGTWTYTWGHGRELESMFRILTEGSDNGGLQVETESTGVKNGLFLDSDGEIRYYVDGSATYMGLIYVNGYYYYIRSSGVAARNTTYWVTNNNGLMESTTYHFDAYGRMTNPPDGSYVATTNGTGMQVDYTYDADGLRKTKTVTTGTLVTVPRNGLHWDDDGELRYYVDGYQTHAGLILVDGHYYYINSSGAAVRNRRYWPTHNNGLLPSKTYTFNEYGWLIDPDTDGAIEVDNAPFIPVSDDVAHDWILDAESTTAVTYTYTYNGGTLARMTGGGDTLLFSYDASGKPMAVTWGTTTYLYLTNLQGDVIAILDTAGNQVVQYTYDAWGKILTTTGTLADTLGTLNPITYRGYVYDTETGLYYVSSRYYDPEIGRFINADAFSSTGQGFVGNNMFAYCGNNPISRVDVGGHFWDIVFDVVSLGFGIADVIENPDDPMAWLGVAADVASLIVPFASGGGTAVRAATKADDVVDTVKLINSADNIVDGADNIGDTARALENAQTAAKVHGNSLSTTKETVGYVLRKNGTDEIMKFGETTRGMRRYTNKFYRENDVYMDILEVGTKRAMHTWQHNMILDYYETYGKLPPLNKSFW